MSDFNVSKITPEFKKISVFSNNETDSLFGAGDVTFDIFSSGLSNLGITSNKDQSNLWNFLNANGGKEIDESEYQAAIEIFGQEGIFEAQDFEYFFNTDEKELQEKRNEYLSELGIVQNNNNQVYSTSKSINNKFFNANSGKNIPNSGLSINDSLEFLGETISDKDKEKILNGEAWATKGTIALATLTHGKESLPAKLKNINSTSDLFNSPLVEDLKENTPAVGDIVLLGEPNGNNLNNRHSGIVVGIKYDEDNNPVSYLVIEANSDNASGVKNPNDKVNGIGIREYSIGGKDGDKQIVGMIDLTDDNKANATLNNNILHSDESEKIEPILSKYSVDESLRYLDECLSSNDKKKIQQGQPWATIGTIAICAKTLGGRENLPDKLKNISTTNQLFNSEFTDKITERQLVVGDIVLMAETDGNKLNNRHSGVLKEIVYDENNNIVGYYVEEANSDSAKDSSKTNNGVAVKFYSATPKQGEKQIIASIDVAKLKEEDKKADTVEGKEEATIKPTDEKSPDPAAKPVNQDTPTSSNVSFDGWEKISKYEIQDGDTLVLPINSLDKILSKIETNSVHTKKYGDQCAACGFWYATWIKEARNNKELSNFSLNDNGLPTWGSNCSSSYKHEKSKEKILQNIYEELNNSKHFPPILQIRSNSSNKVVRHFVPVIGYVKGAGQPPKESDLIIIDTADGQIKRLTEGAIVQGRDYTTYKNGNNDYDYEYLVICDKT